MKRARVLLLAALSTLAAAAAAQVGGGFQHVVREGETLASIAERYYGDPRRESVLVAENGLTVGGGAPIQVGLRLQIPYVTYHIVGEGETWAELAARFYGDSRRAFVLIEANHGSSSEQPDAGAQLVVPYPLRHIAAQNENVARVAKVYYGPGIEGARRLRRFNGRRSNRLTRGEVLLVPLSDIALSEEGRNIVQEATGQAPESDDLRELQARIDTELPQLHELLRRGRFTEAVALGNHLLGARFLTGTQIVGIQTDLATAYVALRRDDLAVQAFRAALDRQPDLRLPDLRTSPTVMRAFREAQDMTRSDGEEEGEDAEADEGSNEADAEE